MGGTIFQKEGAKVKAEITGIKTKTSKTKRVKAVKES